MDLSEKETLPQLIRRALTQPRDEVLVERVNGAWTATSSARLLERIENVACAIRDSGLVAGDRVGLIAHDCVDWIVCDFATFVAGCVAVPIYPTQALDHLAFILEHSGAKLIFADSQATCQRILQSGAPSQNVVLFGSSGPDGLAEFEERGAAIRAKHPELPAAYEATLLPDDLAVLIYTSGTTGNPKGVMLSHDNLGFDARSTLDFGLFDAEPGERAISVLPYSHIYEHTFIYIYLLAGVRYYICHDPNELLADLQDVRPAMMTSVPRIFDRVLAGVRGQAMKHGGAQRKLVPWALSIGRRYAHAKIFGSGPALRLVLEYQVAYALVLKKIRRRLGLDQMRLMCSGSAALHVDTAMTFLGLGIAIMQGYGMTETSPVITASRPADNEYGAVGRPICGVEVRIATDGEILTRGRHVMHGYYRDPQATAAVMEDGWLRTGDVGELDPRGFLRITDRKREVFKTDTGKWIAPARVEAAIKRSVYVAQAMVVGNGRPYPVALICPNWDVVRVRLELPATTSPEQLAARDDVVGFITDEVRKQTADLAGYEQIRLIAVLPHEFSVESGELSPAMKIKRRVVEDRYAAEIEKIYGGELRMPSPA
ncbi:MAG: long-chain fatty acid--CoA ligase [Candidatus Eremiobacteraeota bacterium]|nr:long-chain fatty acid--CoA ligase [Candidatus Eremiobacteraeota bacterium]MBV8374257.1 long-chain fatty acid--CoA ligase [Candidatus Eremiobacteraeota bacterium]